MDELFSNDIQDLQGLGLIGGKEKELLEKVDLAAEELGVSEYEHYLKHEFNDKAIDIAKKHGLFAINADKEFGGKESGFLVHALYLYASNSLPSIEDAILRSCISSVPS